jgi:hypothetical protein
MTSFNLDAKSRAVLDVGRMRGWPVPPAAEAATAIYNAAAAVANLREAPAPPLPTSAKAVPAWIAKCATARLEHRESGAIAVELMNVATDQLVAATRSVLRDFIERLAVEFDDTAARFADVLAIAPRTIVGYETPEQLEAHTSMLRLSAELTRAAADRMTLATTTGEAAMLGEYHIRDAGGFAWLILDPKPEANVDAVIAAVRQYANGAPVTVDGWAEASACGLKLAGPNEAPQRAELFSAAMDIRGRTDPSRGMLASTWGDAVQQTQQRTSAA